MRAIARLISPCLVMALQLGSAIGDDFFSVGTVKFISDPSKGEKGPYRKITIDGKLEKKFLPPCLEVKLRTQANIRADSTYAKAYFFDRDGKEISQSKPHSVSRGGWSNYAIPSLFKNGEWSNVYYAVPESLQKSSGWKAVVVFGDKHSADAKVYPRGDYRNFEFSAREQVEFPKRVERKEAMDPVVEYVVKTRNPKQPQITLMLRPPIGMTDASEAKGVLALCVLADSVQDIKRRLQTLEPNDDLSWTLRFAEEHKLVILCWGSRGLWSAGKNWNELSKQSQKNFDENFTDISEAWARGVKDLARKYGIPEKGFLLTGSSGAAQYAARLALRQPDLFHAVYIHIPSSFDRPTPEANRVLWCLTTGELESGYARSLKFYTACRELGYPIVYKAIIGIGHEGSPYAAQIGNAFFEWALKQKEEREKFDAELARTFSPLKQEWDKNPLQPWPEAYRNPLHVGDAVNQEMFPWKDRDMVPEGFRVPLPTKEIAKAWNAQKL